MHLLLPYAAALAPGCEAAQRELPLPHLERLLARLAPDALPDEDSADEFTLSPPHERALARTLGLAGGDGRLPWAARAAALAGGDPAALPRAWVTPCYWQVATDHITMPDPAALGLTEAESRALLALVLPYFAEDGIALEYLSPLCWSAHGEPLRGLATASLDRVTGRGLDLWMPDGSAARPLRRLQTELQMLLYTHPSTDERNARGLPAVNSFWFSGTGEWTPGARADAPELRMPTTLRDAALHEDWAGWADAWRAIDAGACAELLALLDQGAEVRLTLCGERRALAFRAGAAGAWQRLRSKLGGAFGRTRLADLAARL